MNAEWLLKISQLSILLGGIMIAAGGYGAYHFNQMIDKKNSEEQTRQYKQQHEQLTQLNEKFDKLISSKSAISNEQKKNIIEAVDQAEKPNLVRLKSSYNLGYALLYVDKENWYYVPRSAELKVNWFSTRIISQSEKQIEILLPEYTDQNQNHFIGNQVTLDRKPGNNVAATGNGAITLIVEYLDTINGNAAIAVGFKKHNSMGYGFGS